MLLLHITSRYWSGPYSRNLCCFDRLSLIAHSFTPSVDIWDTPTVEAPQLLWMELPDKEKNSWSQSEVAFHGLPCLCNQDLWFVLNLVMPLLLQTLTFRLVSKWNIKSESQFLCSPVIAMVQPLMYWGRPGTMNIRFLKTGCQKNATIPSWGACTAITQIGFQINHLWSSKICSHCFLRD